ncbi:unnamed protein product [Mucor fragilis]
MIFNGAWIMLITFLSRASSRPMSLWIDRAQQRYTNILSKYFSTNSERETAINTNYKTLTNSAYYLRFLGKKKDPSRILKADLAVAELINSTLNRRLVASSCSANEDTH